MRSAILAGGGSRRFGGKPKGLSRVGGVRIVDRVAEILRKVTGSDPIVIFGNEGQKNLLDDYETIVDPVPGAGTLGGIYSAVTGGRGPVLLAAWDMPFLCVDLLRRLVDDSRGRDAMLPSSTGRRGVEPLCAVYDHGCAAPILDQLHSDDLKAVGFHDRVNIGILPLGEVQNYGDPGRLFFNVNSDADLQLAEEMWLKQE